MKKKGLNLPKMEKQLDEVLKTENFEFMNKKETLEEAAKKDLYEHGMESFTRGAKWQLENLTKKDLINLPLVEEMMMEFISQNFTKTWLVDNLPSDIFEDYKQSILKESEPEKTEENTSYVEALAKIYFDKYKTKFASKALEFFAIRDWSEGYKSANADFHDYKFSVRMKVKELEERITKLESKL